MNLDMNIIVFHVALVLDTIDSGKRTVMTDIGKLFYFHVFICEKYKTIASSLSKSHVQKDLFDSIILLSVICSELNDFQYIIISLIYKSH